MDELMLRVRVLQRVLAELDAGGLVVPTERAASLRVQEGQLKIAISDAKARAKEHKREMTAWYGWFHSLSAVERVEQRDTLEAESRRRAAAISVIEAEITQLEGQRVAIRARCAAAESHEGRTQAADDPRRQRIVDELARARAALAARQQKG